MSLNWINRKVILLTSLIILIGAGVYLISAFLLVDHSLSEDDTSNNEPNRAPLFKELPNRILNEDSQLLDTIDLTYFCSDPDSDALSYSIIRNTEPNCGISINTEDMIDITPEYNWNGISSVTIQASDGELSANKSFAITVTPVNDPPTITNFYPMISPEINVNESQLFAVTALDVDHDVLEYRWYLNDSMVDGDNTNYVYTPSQENNGNYTVKVEAKVSDGICTLEQTWYLDVFNDTMPSVAHNFQMEVGAVQLTNTIDQNSVASINFNNTYKDPPVVVAYIKTQIEDESVEVRIDNVTNSGCDIFMEEPGDGSHASEYINYIIITEGEWAFPDGTEIKAGKIMTDKNHHGPSVYDNWEQMSFNTSFFNPPVILHSLNTYNNRAFKTSVVDDVSFSSFKIQQESAETGTSTEQETIAWIAIESGKIGTLNNIKYETVRANDGNNDGVDDGGHMFAFSQDYFHPPLVIVKQGSANNIDGSWARSDGVITPSSHRTNAEEDQVGDSERTSPDEYFGLIAFEKSFSYGFDYNPSPSYPGVLSVEHVELTLTGTSNSSQLTKNQNIANCIPFVTMKQQAVEENIWDNSMCDIFFTDTGIPTVHAERTGNGGVVILSIYIIEFDGVSIKVQNGAFFFSENYIDQTINEINPLSAVPIAYYKISGGDDGWDCAMITTDFRNSTSIHMERGEGTGTVSGHYYIFEAQNEGFYVQKVQLSMSFIEEYNYASIDPIDMDKTFIVSSYMVEVSNDDTEEGAVDVWLNTATEVGSKRNPAANNFAIPIINVFIVSFKEICNVQRGVFTWQPSDISKQQDITEVNQELSIIKSGQMYGIAKCDGIEDHDTQSAFFEHLFIDNNTIQLERYTTSQSAEIHWEVIEFISL